MTRRRTQKTYLSSWQKSKPAPQWWVVLRGGTKVLLNTHGDKERGRASVATCGATDDCNMELDRECFSRLARERVWHWGWGLKARTHRQRMP